MSEYIKNFSYIFIPFSLDKEDKLWVLHDGITASGLWEEIDDEIKYLHRYVSEKLVRGKGASKNAYHYRLKDNSPEATALFSGIYGTDPKDYRGERGVCFPFTINDVQLYAFNSSVCMLAFELRFEGNAPLHIAAAQYYLRKITTERVHKLSDADGEKMSFVDISRRLLSSQLESCGIDFFFYAISGNERANFLTYVDVPRKDDHGEELFHLKWCYHDKFDYNKGYDDDGGEDYSATPNTDWGISPSAAVCLATRDNGQERFIETTFQKNFRRHYLMTYVFLLHQKYMMYLFLTKMSVGIDEDLHELERYKKRLYEFETHYMFSHISEVPQYQRFYSKVKKAFALDEMFADVREPLAQLAEIQRQHSEKEKKEYDDKMNTALTTLSILTVVSALADATGITPNLTWLIPLAVSRGIQIVLLCAVVFFCIYMFVRLFSIKNKR